MGRMIGVITGNERNLIWIGIYAFRTWTHLAANESLSIKMEREDCIGLQECVTLGRISSRIEGRFWSRCTENE